MTVNWDNSAFANERGYINWDRKIRETEKSEREQAADWLACYYLKPCCPNCGKYFVIDEYCDAAGVRRNVTPRFCPFCGDPREDLQPTYIARDVKVVPVGGGG